MVKHIVVDNVSYFFADKELSKKKLTTKNEINIKSNSRKINLLFVRFKVAGCFIN